MRWRSPISAPRAASSGVQKVTWNDESRCSLARLAAPFRAGLHEKAPSRGGGEGDGQLKLGVITPAGALPGVGPVVVENVLALAVALGVERGHADHLAARPRDEMAGLPAGACAH